MPEMGYEKIRKYLHKERRNPNVYTKNRCEALIERTKIECGEGAQKEMLNEFRYQRKVGKYSSGADFDKDGKLISG